MIYFIVIILWFALGYACWRAVYYGDLKRWYIEYKEDYRTHNNGNNALAMWVAVMPIIIIGGAINIIILAILWRQLSCFKQGLTLHFKIPVTNEN